MVVVITDIIFDHIHQLFLDGKSFAVVAFPLQNTPESFHSAVVNALGHTGQVLRHSGFLQFVVEGSAGTLKASVTMEKRTHRDCPLLHSQMS